MRQMHDKLTNDVQTLQQRRQVIKAKVAVAKTQDRINKVTSSMDAASGSMKAFERMEEKADRMLDQVNSMAELNEKPVDIADELEAKYSNSDVAVDEELEKLKKEMGL